jgi:hypothetical protein
MSNNRHGAQRSEWKSMDLAAKDSFHGGVAVGVSVGVHKGKAEKMKWRGGGPVRACIVSHCRMPMCTSQCLNKSMLDEASLFR